MRKIFKKILFLVSLLILIFLAIGYYNLKFLEKEKKFQRETSILCDKYKAFPSEISCQEAIKLVLAKYPGAVISLAKLARPSLYNPNVWFFGLKTVDSEGNQTTLEVFVTKDKNVVPIKSH